MLVAQREYLLAANAEERERWEGERAGWERAAEALIRRGAKRAGGNEVGIFVGFFFYDYWN